MQAAPIRITLRLIVSLIIAMASVATVSAYRQVGQERHRQQEELERRSRLLAETLQESVEPLVPQGAASQLQRLVERFGNRERLAGVAVYDSIGRSLAITPGVDTMLPTPPTIVSEATARGIDAGAFDRIGDKDVHASAVGGVRILEPASDLALALADQGQVAVRVRPVPKRDAARRTIDTSSTSASGWPSGTSATNDVTPRRIDSSSSSPSGSQQIPTCRRRRRRASSC